MPDLYIHFYSPSVSDSAGEIHAQEHRIGRTLLSRGLNDLFQIRLSPAELDNKIAFTEHEKPWLPDYPDIHFNISHCDDLVICGFDTHPIGVDAEKIRPFPEALLRRLLTPEEKIFFEQVSTSETLRREWLYRYWTLKESYLKQTGSGLSIPLTDVAFQFDCSAQPLQIICSDTRFTFYQQVLKTGHVIALCMSSPVHSVRMVQSGEKTISHPI